MRDRWIIAAALVLACAAGCRAPRPAFPDGRSAFRYAGPPSARTLAITPPEDRRRKAVYVGNHNLAFIPFMAYAQSEVYRPEDLLAKKAGRQGPAFFEPRVSIMDGLVEELSSERVFAEVRAAPRAEEAAGVPTPSADLVLSSRIYETSARCTRITACGSVFGYAALGILGIPNLSFRERLVVDLSLTETATGREVWRARITEEDSFVKSFYYGRRYDLSNDFARLFRQGLGPALGALGQFEAGRH